MKKLTDFERGRIRGLEQAAWKCESWARESAGGSGEEIVPSGPNKGQRYGEAYFNLADSIRKIVDNP
jgi:hypothetical protein